MKLDVGELVNVPVGLDMLVGEVVDLYDSGSGPQIVVRVLPSAQGPIQSDEFIVTLPASAVEPATKPHAESGSWAPALHYERQVWDALRRLMEPSPAKAYTAMSHREEPDGGTDITFSDGNHRVNIGLKFIRSGRFTARTLQQVLSSRRNPEDRLILTNAEVSAVAHKILREMQAAGRDLHVVTWRSLSDDPKLERAIREAFERDHARRSS